MFFFIRKGMPKEEVQEPAANNFLWIILLIIVIIAVLVLVLLMKRKKPEEHVPQDHADPHSQEQNLQSENHPEEENIHQEEHPEEEGNHGAYNEPPGDGPPGMPEKNTHEVPEGNPQDADHPNTD